VKPINVDDPDEYRRRMGIPKDFASCHTAEVEGYVIEGHVPVEDIRRLLEQRPEAKALVVPGMPAGSPGMEGARRDPYDVLLLKHDGTTSVFKSYR
jgi:hypothetical protein